MCQHPDLSPSSVSDVGLVSTNLHVFKTTQDDKLGVSFFADEPEVRVRLVHKGSLAASCGLQADDVITSINGVPCCDALDAARSLRNATGEVLLAVERQLTCSVPEEDDECDDYMLSPPRRLFSPPKDDADAEYSDQDEHGDEHGDETYDEASADEWNEWLWWMVERIRAREAELSDLQQRTADMLAQTMTDEEQARAPPTSRWHTRARRYSVPCPSLSCMLTHASSSGARVGAFVCACVQPPTPPKEEDMVNPDTMERFMTAMAEYSVRQRDRLEQNDANSVALEENREATAALALLVARREELEAYRQRVQTLTEVDAARIEDIWRELAREESEEPESDEGDAADASAELPDGAAPEPSGAIEEGGSVVVRTTGRAAADEEVEKILIGANAKPAAVRGVAEGGASVPDGGHALRTLAAVDANRLSTRLTCTAGDKDKYALLHERLQRARSKGARPAPCLDEVGVLIHPL